MRLDVCLASVCFCINLSNVRSDIEKDPNSCVKADTLCSEGNRRMESDQSMAVVVYDETSIPLLSKPERKFNFAGQGITIKQDWGNVGVAGVVWDAALVLCQYLEQNPALVKESSVIEIGAGTGLVGIVATLLGGIVTVTDRTEVLEVVQKAVDSNVPENHMSSIKVRPLDWTKDLDKYSQTYDIILGADVIYIEEVFPDLLKTLIHLSSKDTLILLSCRIRYDRDTYFLSMLEEYFTVKQILYDTDRDVKVLEVKKINEIKNKV